MNTKNIEELYDRKKHGYYINGEAFIHILKFVYSYTDQEIDEILNPLTFTAFVRHPYKPEIIRNTYPLATPYNLFYPVNEIEKISNLSQFISKTETYLFLNPEINDVLAKDCPYRDKKE